MLDIDNNNFYYKFCSINNYTKENLKLNQFYFSNPMNFNDPFDSRTDCIYRGTRKGWEHYLRKNGINISINTLIKEGTLKRKGSELLLNPNKKGLPHTEAKYGSDLGEDHFCRVSCFTKKYKNILMWSHYADSHKGICLCINSEPYSDNSGHFLRLDSDPEKYPFIKVNYSEEMPKQLNLLYINEWPDIIDFVRTKHTDWTYEQEYRLVVNLQGQNEMCLKKFPKNNLKAIIFGLKIEKDDVKDIYEIIRDNYLGKGIDVEFFKVMPIPRKYAIEIKKIESMNKYLNKLQ